MEQLLSDALVINILIVIYYIWLIYQFNKYSFQRTTVPTVTIKDVVSRDCQHLGSYDDKLKYSLTVWLYSILVVCYQKDTTLEVKSKFIEWNDKYNHDPEGLIYECIQESWTRFLLVLDASREFKEEPKFKVSSKFDYHNLPKTLKYNDYISTDELIKAIDTLVKEVD